MNSDKALDLYFILFFVFLATWIASLFFKVLPFDFISLSTLRGDLFGLSIIFLGIGCCLSDNYDGELIIPIVIGCLGFMGFHYGIHSDRYFLAFFMLCQLATGIVVFLLMQAERAARKVYRDTKETVHEIIQEFKVFISELIDKFSIKSNVRQKCPHALKVKILEKRKNAVNVGIFGNSNTMIAKETIESSEGVAQDLYVGQEIIC